MDIEEVKKVKEGLTKHIAETLEQFTKETGVFVTDIRFERLKIQTLLEEEPYEVRYRVRIDTGL